MTPDDTDDVTGLKRKNHELLGELKRAQARIRELEGRPRPEEMTTRQRFFAEAARRLVGLEGEALAAEVAKLQQEMVPLIEAEVAEHAEQLKQRIETMRSTVRRVTLANAATQLALKIRRPGVDPSVLHPLLLERLDAEETSEGDFTVTAKNADGQPVSPDALAEEFRANPALAPVVAGASEAEKEAHARKVAETLGQARPNGAAR